MYCLNLMRIALELAQHNPVYEDIATKFFEHFLYIAAGHDQHRRAQGIGLWDEADEFYYDVLHLPDGQPCAAQGPLDGRPDSAVRRRDARAGAAATAAATSPTRLEWFLQLPARPGAAWCRAGTSRARASGGCCRCCAATA